MEELGGQVVANLRWDVAGRDEHAVVIRMAGELDLGSVEPLDDAVSPLLVARPEQLILDVTDLRFADSSAIALWVKWASAVGRIELRGPNPLLRRIIQSMGLDDVLHALP